MSDIKCNYREHNQMLVKSDKLLIDDILNDRFIKNKYVIHHITHINNNKIVMILKDKNYKYIVAKIFTYNTDYQENYEIFKKISKINCINVAKPLEFYLGDTYWLITYEYYDGDNLYDYIKLNPLTPCELENIILQISNGLHELHKHDIIHCDIKLQNIVITQSKQIKIIDFDLSKVTSGYYVCDHIFGTKNYISPESKEICIYSKKSDIWELGVLFYWLVSNEFPYDISDDDFCEYMPRKNVYKNINFDKLKHIVTSKNINSKIYNLIINMLQFKDDDRPTIDNVINSLTS